MKQSREAPEPGEQPGFKANGLHGKPRVLQVGPAAPPGCPAHGAPSERRPSVFAVRLLHKGFWFFVLLMASFLQIKPYTKPQCKTGAVKPLWPESGGGPESHLPKPALEKALEALPKNPPGLSGPSEKTQC